jgi:hypothetical protein
MSLKFFHILFITLSTLLSLGVGLWAIDTWRADGDITWLALALVAFGGGGGLVVYANRFLQKVRKLGIAGLLVAGSLGLPAEALACTVCIGNSASPLRSGLSLGILALLGITGFLLVCFASFFIYLARKARSARVEPAKGPALDIPLIREGSM